MRYVATGGGSGGHVTPIKHVAAALRSQDHHAEVFFVGQKGDRFAELIDTNDVRAKKYIRAGKLRRYPRPLWQTIIDIKTILLNIRDVFLVGIGYLQALLYLHKIKPDVVFKAGGYVGVPVCLAAATLGIPFVTHDADMIPGLANKLVAKWAKFNAVPSIVGEYGYDKNKLRVVGVPIGSHFFRPYSQNDRSKARKAIGAGQDTTCLFVIGGGLGAQSINQAMLKIAPDLIDNVIDVFHITGANNYDDAKEELDKLDDTTGYTLINFVTDQNELFNYYLAADIMISRAGAFSTAEIAALGKPAIIIPAQQLADQQVNGKALEAAEAAVVLQDSDIKDDPNMLFEAIDLIIKDEELNFRLSTNIRKWVEHDASGKMAKLLLEVANG